MSEIIKVRQLFLNFISNDVSGCFFSETRCIYCENNSHHIYSFVSVYDIVVSFKRCHVL